MADRLLQQHVTARLHGGDGLPFVQVVRRAHVHDVEFGLGEHLLVVGEASLFGHDVLFAEQRQPCLGDVSQSDELDAFHGSQQRRVTPLGDAAAADDPHS